MNETIKPQELSAEKKEVFNKISRVATEISLSKKAVDMDEDGLIVDDQEYFDQETRQMTKLEGTHKRVAGKAITLPPPGPIDNVIVYDETSVRNKKDPDPFVIVIFPGLGWQPEFDKGAYYMKKSGKISRKGAHPNDRPYDTDNIKLDEKAYLLSQLEKSVEMNEQWLANPPEPMS